MGKTGIYGMIGAAGVVVMLLAVTFYQSHQLTILDDNIAKAKQRAAMLKKDIQLVDGLIDVKTKITQRMEAVEKLDSHRSSWVKVLEDIARNVPEFVWIQKFEELGPKSAPVAKADKNKNSKKKKKKEIDAYSVAASINAPVKEVKIEGYSFTLNALASFMINMMRSDYFENVELVSSEEKKLDSDDSHKAYNFVITCDLHFLSDEKLRNLIASTKIDNKNKGSKTSHKVLN